MPSSTRAGRTAFAALGSEAVVLVTDERRLDQARLAVEAELRLIDRTCSRFRPDSDLERVNEAGGVPVEVDPLLMEAIAVGLRAARLTDGDVDPTVGEALRVLGYDRDFATMAARGGPVVRVMPVPGWRLVELDVDRRTVRIPAGVRLDLGATAKALAADRAARSAGAFAGCGVLVSLGGDIAIDGEPPAGGWDVRVADWHGADADAEGQTVSIDSGGLATSSTTVRHWSRGDDELHHVIDPATGRPAPVVWRTVSVAAATCVDANIAATAAIVRGRHAPLWLESLGLPARLVRPDGSVVALGGWPADESGPTGSCPAQQPAMAHR